MRPFSTLAAVIFAAVALAHLLRLVYAWPVVFNGWVVPVWLSAIPLAVAAALALLLWREAQR